MFHDLRSFLVVQADLSVSTPHVIAPEVLRGSDTKGGRQLPRAPEGPGTGEDGTGLGGGDGVGDARGMERHRGQRRTLLAPRTGGALLGRGHGPG